MKKNKYHINFHLNGKTFSSSEEIIKFSTTISKELCTFFKEWFSNSRFMNVYTSGSTGKPAIIQLQKKHMIQSALSTASFFKLPEKTLALCCLPLGYIAGKMMLVRALTLGWHLDVVKPSSSPLTSLKKVYDFSAMVPLQLSNSLDKMYLIRKLIVGGGVVPYSLEKSIQNITTHVYATYGMTETITHVAVKPLNYVTHNPNKTTYKTLPNVTIDLDSRGCLIINAPTISSEKVVTNDVVEIISETEFIWKGRFDNVINSGGIKLYPEVLEKKISSKITRRFFMAGVPDNKLGEKLLLFIEGKPYNINKKNIFLELSKFEIPKEIIFISQFIETKTGKIQRIKTIKTS